MILSDVTLKKLIDSKELEISPIDEGAIQPGSIDCRLGTTFLTVSDKNKQPISLSQEIIYDKVEGDLITIPAHSFLLATTQEYIKLPDNITAFVEGRSSVGRIGLFIQVVKVYHVLILNMGSFHFLCIFLLFQFNQRYFLFCLSLYYLHSFLGLISLSFLHSYSFLCFFIND